MQTLAERHVNNGVRGTYRAPADVMPGGHASTREQAETLALLTADGWNPVHTHGATGCTSGWIWVRLGARNAIVTTDGRWKEGTR